MAGAYDLHHRRRNRCSRLAVGGISSLDELGTWLGYWLSPDITPTTGTPIDATQWTDGSGTGSHMVTLRVDAADHPHVIDT